MGGTPWAPSEAVHNSDKTMKEAVASHAETVMICGGTVGLSVLGLGNLLRPGHAIYLIGATGMPPSHQRVTDLSAVHRLLLAHLR